MATAMITLPKNFQASDLSNEDVKTNSLGGKVVYLKYKSQKKLYRKNILAFTFL